MKGRNDEITSPDVIERKEIRADGESDHGDGECAQFEEDRPAETRVELAN